MEEEKIPQEENKIEKKTSHFKGLFLFAFLLFFFLGFFIGVKYYPFLEKEIQNLLSWKVSITLPKITFEKKGTTTRPLTLPKESQEKEYQSEIELEKNVMRVVDDVNPSVVSIIITKDLPVFEQYYINPFKDFFGEDFDIPEFGIPQYRQKGTEKKEVGGGTGFIISEDGLVLTNKHVVSDKEAEYTVITNDGKRYPAKVLALDPVQDLAFIKIEKKITDLSPFKPVKLGDSSQLKIGQFVIAIGNALGEFRNTVSFGVISGLGRTITASGAGMVETLENVIQTDAAINQGNSGGPLLNLKGEVIGVNVAMAQGAQNIGFAIPINQVKRDIEQIQKTGKIIYPWLGVRYILVTPEIQQQMKLEVDYGALIVKGNNPDEVAVIPDSPADKVGLKEGDIILELDGKKITPQNSLSKIISEYSPGDKVTLKVLRKKETFEVNVTLAERPQ